MAGVPKTATRASTRSKPAAPAPPPTTTTRTTRARTATASSTVVPVATKKPVVRKPLASRANAVDAPVAAAKPAAKQQVVRKAAKHAVVPPTDTDREPIMAYLRIRPQLSDDQLVSSPYLTPLSDTSVRMTDPQDPQNNTSRFRPSVLPPSSIYTFSHVFPTNTTQSDFFTKTTLPLVRDVLQGQNALLFTYGVTNSGKTYTVQGGTAEGSAGILPRTLDVMFNSIDGLHGDGRFRPVRLQGIEPADSTDFKPPPITPEAAVTEVLGQLDTQMEIDMDIDPTILKLDRNYEYTIWLSYAEVYNEKVYDLLTSVNDDTDINTTGNRTNTNKPLLLTRKALPLKPSPQSDCVDSSTTGKYISGLRQFRVHSASQAKALVKLGQLHRRVFGTLANRESSRSHGMVFLKVVRGHRGERDDPTALQVSRLTLVDLAGSERMKHTHTTGDRLKEAGNINKSLMVLGQCMEVMRSNQRKVAVSLSQEGIGEEGRMDTRDVKKALAVVPFRHSKLTEALMDYFVGDGRAVMIVNVNPYDTGFDENSHVMRFAALAREVYVTPAPAPLQRVPTMVGPGKTHGTKIKELGPLTLKDPDITPLPYNRRKVTISMGGPGSGRKASEATLEVLEEDESNEEQDGDDSDDEPINPLVDALFDEVEQLRLQLFEAEMRCAIVEAETREEVMREMEERMRNMEQNYSRRLMKEVEQNEMKTDAKIDMLHQSGLFGSPTKRAVPLSPLSDLSEEADVEMSLVDYGQDEHGSESDSGSGEEFSLAPESKSNKSGSISPLAGKGKAKVDAKRGSTVIREMRKHIPDPPMLASDAEDAELTETDDGESATTSKMSRSQADEDEDVEDDEDEGEEEEEEEEEEDTSTEEDEWAPPVSASSKTKASKGNVKKQRPPSSSPEPPRRTSTANKGRISKLAQEMNDLELSDDGVQDDSVIILPVKKFRARIESTQDSDDDEVEVVAKKKKRVLGKKPVVTEEQIEKVTFAAENRIAKSENARQSIRRLVVR